MFIAHFSPVPFPCSQQLFSSDGQHLYLRDKHKLRCYQIKNRDGNCVADYSTATVDPRNRLYLFYVQEGSGVILADPIATGKNSGALSFLIFQDDNYSTIWIHRAKDGQLIAALSLESNNTGRLLRAATNKINRKVCTSHFMILLRIFRLK